MKNSSPLFKRIGAYIIDVYIVFTIASLVSGIQFLNPNYDTYQKLSKEYDTLCNNYINAIKLLNESYEDNILSEEEYNKFSESVYKDIIAAKFDDKELTKDEHQEVVKKINEDFGIENQDYKYLLKKNNIGEAVVTLVLTLLYFGILQYLFKGQTIGKKLLKLQVVSATDKKLNVFTYILRTFIVNNFILNTIGTIFLIIASKQTYVTADEIIYTLISIVQAVVIFTMMSRDDARGVHDLLFGTKVISTEVVKEQEKTIEIQEEPIETQKPKKKAPTKKKTSSTKNKDKVVEAKYKEKKTNNKK